MIEMSRRELLGVSASFLLAAGAGAKPTGKCTFSFSTYGMKTLKTEDAIRTVSEVGYDGIEITIWPDWDAEPARMSAERRQALRKQISDRGLKLTSLMEHIAPAKDDAQHAKDLERLKIAAQLANDLSPGAPPLIQTVLGGGDWEECRERFRDRLAGWVEVGKAAGVVIAIKPHRGGAMSRPAEAVWLIQQLGDTPWLRMVYDYSHYAFRGMSIADTVATALPYTGHIAVKDAVQEGEKVVFALPGESGTCDYGKLFGLFVDGGYSGDVCCEISGMVWSRPDYDPVATAKVCYANLAPVLAEAGARRER